MRTKRLDEPWNGIFTTLGTMRLTAIRGRFYSWVFPPSLPSLFSFFFSLSFCLSFFSHFKWISPLTQVAPKSKKLYFRLPSLSSLSFFLLFFLFFSRFRGSFFFYFPLFFSFFFCLFFESQFWFDFLTPFVRFLTFQYLKNRAPVEAGAQSSRNRRFRFKFKNRSKI